MKRIAGILAPSAPELQAPASKVVMSLGAQVAWLFVLAIPIACVARTVTHEEVFCEPRDYCKQRSQHVRSIAGRKFFYLFTCEYCFTTWLRRCS
jgi:hypothetical protein